MTREEALAKVRELLHGEEAKASMSSELRYAIDMAVCAYGHAAAMQALRNADRARKEAVELLTKWWGS